MENIFWSSLSLGLVIMAILIIVHDKYESFVSFLMTIGIYVGCFGIVYYFAKIFNLIL